MFLTSVSTKLYLSSDKARAGVGSNRGLYQFTSPNPSPTDPEGSSKLMHANSSATAEVSSLSLKSSPALPCPFSLSEAPSPSSIRSYSQNNHCLTHFINPFLSCSITHPFLTCYLLHTGSYANYSIAVFFILFHVQA
uniref:Uncharacterized protein n=1 Tax=Picea glauca TaxID=3330 RepID=A0A124GMD8_PICGL|nr:hypothetical protein ABT39_MTgene3396 [Picea glauca]QHR88995.1 hypothetical protein Q903MT_gene3014 [Picea sitchensis]